MNNTRILIPVKGVSRRCPDKNKKLLPFAANYLKRQEVIKHATVISDSIELLDFAKSLGFDTFKESRQEGQDELVSCYNFIKDKGCEEFFLFPVTQPFRGEELLNQCYSIYLEQKDNIDFVTSYTDVANRERFYLDFNEDGIPVFKNNSINRKGELCRDISMVDGALFLIKSAFIEKVALSENSNATFWSGTFACVKNDVPFMDIDTILDMKKFNFMKRYFDRYFEEKCEGKQ